MEKFRGVDSAPSTTEVAVIVLLAPLAHFLPEAQRGAEQLEDRAYSDPGCVVVQHGDGVAATERFELLQLLGGGSPCCWGCQGVPWGARVGGGGGRWLRGNLDHVKELVGELWDVFLSLSAASLVHASLP